jgi:ACS family glucarate transporter-like MFS transporter
MAVPKPELVFDTQADEGLPALRNSSQRWWLLLLLFSAMLISYAHRSALSVAAPFISKDLNLSKAEMGILLSSFFWIYAFMQMPAGWIVDRFGVRRAYSLGFIFWSLASCLTGLGTGMASLLGLRIATGAGQAITFPASSRAVANWYPQRERGMVTGVYLSGVRLGAALIAWIGGMYFVAGHSWKSFFLIIGLAPIVWLLPWNKFLRKWEPVVAKDKQTRQASFLQSFSLLRHRSVLGIFLGFFAYDYAWYVFLTWLPSYLKDERKFTTSEMGVYSATPLVAMSVIIIIAGTLSDWLVKQGYAEKIVRKAFIILGLAIGCLIVPAGLVADKISAVWLLTISLCGLGLASPNTWTLTAAVCQKKIVGTVAGIQNFGGNLGGILAPAVTGFIAHKTGSFALALGLTGVVLVIGMLAYWLLIEDQVDLRDLAEPE